MPDLNIRSIRVPVQRGDRIEMVHMDDPDPIPQGTEGTVMNVVNFGMTANIEVRWDNGRTLSLVYPDDAFIKLQGG